MAAKKLPAEFTYDLSEFMKVDPNLIHYEEAAAVETGMKEPRGIAVGAEDRLMLAGDRSIRCSDPQWKTFAELKLAGEPQRLAGSAKDGATYVAMTDHVEVYGPNGRLLATWDPAGPKSVLTCIAVAEKDVFVADAGAPAVLRYDACGRPVYEAAQEGAGRRDLVVRCDPGGRLVNRITGRPALRSPPAASAGEGEPVPGAAADPSSAAAALPLRRVDQADDQGFIVPSPYFDAALASKDRLWIANPGRRRVELYTFDGKMLAHWGKASFKIEGFCGCCNPIHIAVLPSGHLVTSEKGLPRVKVYTPEGELASVVAPPAAFAEGTTGLDVAADSRGRIWVLDPVARKVRLFVRKKTAPALESKA
jgi:sugar lactone lactonase YvrE